MASFNVLTEPWIPAADLDGGVEERGILRTLLMAPELSGIVDPAPPIQFGLYRFLIAFAMDALAIKEVEQVEELLSRGEFDEAKLQHYVDATGRDRFDLFHSDFPFMQSPREPGVGEKPKSIAELFQHLPSGTFATHFNHVKPEDQALSPSVCARGLMTIAPFMTAGGAGYSPSINGAPPWYVLARGDNLFQTIVLNCFALTNLGLDGDEPAAWRSQKRVIPRKEMRCSTILEGLTWRPRQIRLIPGDGGRCSYTGEESPVLVRQMVFSFGFKFSGDWIDPNVAYRESDKGRSPLRPREDRELWRDIGPLMLLRKEEYESENGKVRFSRPLVMEQLKELYWSGVLPRPKVEVVEAYGVRTDGKMKVFEWQYERLGLPMEAEQKQDSGRQLQRAMDLAEKVAYCLRAALKTAYPREGKGNEHAFETAIRSAERRFWSKLRLRFDGDFLLPLADQDENDPYAQPKLEEEWKKILLKAGWEVFEASLDPYDANADSLERQVKARDHFARAISGSLYPSKSGKEKGDKGKGRKRKAERGKQGNE